MYLIANDVAMMCAKKVEVEVELQVKLQLR